MGQARMARFLVVIAGILGVAVGITLYFTASVTAAAVAAIIAGSIVIAGAGADWVIRRQRAGVAPEGFAALEAIVREAVRHRVSADLTDGDPYVRYGVLSPARGWRRTRCWRGAVRTPGSPA